MKHCGYIAIIGKPNVGKSTLLNKILTQKVSITSRKPQTTRHKILGIKTLGDTQFIYVDTPGIHYGEKRAINRYMNKMALSAIGEVDVIIFMVEALNWTDEDQMVLDKLSKIKTPVILAVNKVDTIHSKEQLLPYLEEFATNKNFAAVIPLSATKGNNITDLEQEAARLLPEGEFLFPAEQISDRDQKFLASEIIREKLIRLLGQELPYATTVIIERFVRKNEILNITAVIFVEREGQKAIVIGKGGECLKKIGTYARKELEHLFGEKIYLELWVKVKSQWSDDAEMLRRLGYI